MNYRLLQIFLYHPDIPHTAQILQESTGYSIAFIYYLLNTFRRHRFVLNISGVWFFNPKIIQDVRYYRTLPNIGRQSKNSLPFHLMRVFLYDFEHNVLLSELKIFFRRGNKEIMEVIQKLEENKLIEKHTPNEYRIHSDLIRRMNKNELKSRLERMQCPK